MTACSGQRTAYRIALAACYGLWLTAYGSLAFAQVPSAAPQEHSAAGQLISLDLKGVDIIDVLKLLSQKSGLNFVAGRNVTGRVTIFAKDVDVWEAFELIVETNDLAYEERGNLINVITARDYELLYGEKFQLRTEHRVFPLKFAKAAQLATALNQLKSNVGQVVVDEASNTLIITDVGHRLQQIERFVSQLDRPTETRIYNLNYAEAEKLKEKVQEFLTPGIGTFSFDARTNKVIVTDLQEALPKLEQLIVAYDEQEGEVLIEAKIMNVKLTDKESLGIDWQQIFSAIDTQGRLSFDVVSGSVLSGEATGAALKFTSVSGNTTVVIEALKEFGTVETIANPRITVSNNQEAKILVGTKEAFVTTTTTIPTAGPTINSPEVQFVDVGTKLFVTPQIKRDGHIQMKIRPEVSAVDRTITTISNTIIPVVSTTEAETNVLVKSGSTLIIGGLINTEVEDTKNQLPLLGDIPILGAAFRSRVIKHNKTERVVFLTPQIISASGDHVKEFPPSSPLTPVMQAEAPVSPGYRAMIREMLSRAVADQLQSMAGLGEGSVTVSFLLARDGHVLGDPQITSAQGEAFIQAAKAALKAASPFPPVPGGPADGVVRFQMTVDYRPSS